MRERGPLTRAQFHECVTNSSSLVPHRKFYQFLWDEGWANFSSKEMIEEGRKCRRDQRTSNDHDPKWILLLEPIKNRLHVLLHLNQSIHGIYQPSHLVIPSNWQQELTESVIAFKFLGRFNLIWTTLGAGNEMIRSSEERRTGVGERGI